jgi:hypothetical protein
MAEVVGQLSVAAFVLPPNGSYFFITDLYRLHKLIFVCAVAVISGASVSATVAKPSTDTGDEHAENPAENH